MDALTVRHTRPLIVTAIVVFVLACGGLLVAVRASAGPPTWAPSAAERQKALTVAQSEASTSIPGANGTRPGTLAAGTWPANVQRVTLVGSSRKDASQFVDGSPAEDDRRVVIIRMLGDFSVANTGPAGSNPFSTGHQMTIVVDATTGDVLDFGLESQPTTALPNAIQQYGR
jgi:hypothetical protein